MWPSLWHLRICVCTDQLLATCKTSSHDDFNGQLVLVTYSVAFKIAIRSCNCGIFAMMDVKIVKSFIYVPINSMHQFGWGLHRHCYINVNLEKEQKD